MTADNPIKHNLLTYCICQARVVYNLYLYHSALTQTTKIGSDIQLTRNYHAGQMIITTLSLSSHWIDRKVVIIQLKFHLNIVSLIGAL